MGLSRRGFLAAAGSATVVGTASLSGLLSRLGLDLGPSVAQAEALKTRYAKESTTICPYCGVGCGLIVSAMNGSVINVEGDPAHPVNRGSLCCKGQSLYQVATSDRRLTKVMYRAPRSTEWEEVSWEWAIERIADRVKATRDKYFTQKDDKGRVVNRVHALAGLGGAALDNEECYLYGKLMRALGLVYIEHQARI
jgi:formate dehydrogenase major subunit